MRIAEPNGCLARKVPCGSGKSKNFRGPGRTSFLQTSSRKNFSYRGSVSDVGGAALMVFVQGVLLTSAIPVSLNSALTVFSCRALIRVYWV